MPPARCRPASASATARLRALHRHEDDSASERRTTRDPKRTTNLMATMNAPDSKPVLLCGLTLALCGSAADAQSHNIKNDSFWDTVDGEPIYSQGGGIFQFEDPETGEERYYWYGVHYELSERYRQDPSETFNRGTGFKAVTCYSSTDLVNWKSEGDALTREGTSPDGRRRRGWGWLGRLGVAYVEEAGQYVLIIQSGSQVLFTTADKPTGPFEYQHRKDMTDIIGTSNTGDQTVFTDPDTGKSYLVYSYGRGRNKIYVSEIGLKDGKIDLLDSVQVYRGDGREGNCMFKHDGKYYLAASLLYGWDSSYPYYLVADDIRGPYRPENDMRIFKGAEDDYAHVTQTGFFVTVRGTKQTTVIYCGDRWAGFAGNGLGFNQWCPLSFDGDEPYFNSLNSWNLNAETGEWSVADDNNWVKNPSFEADRKPIPSDNKPRQERLLGWETTVIEGTEVSLDRGSPVLNHENSSEDRQHVIGERSLNIGDRVDFARRVSQEIASSPHVEFKDGLYTLTAKVKNSDGFRELKMYAESAGEEYFAPIRDANAEWTTVRLEGVRVSGNKVEIGFLADGEADSYCRVDDVELVSSEASAAAVPAQSEGVPDVPPPQPGATQAPADVPAERPDAAADEVIEVTKDIPYRDGDSDAWRLDLAHPVGRTEELRPALVIVHGGGWRGGSKSVDVFQNMMKEYAEKGYVTINVEYRLLGEAPFPACIEDVKCAVRWLRAHAEDYHVDPNRIGAYGHSAGAHLALMLALAPKSAGLEGDGGWSEYSSVVNAAVGGSPPTELGRDVPMAKEEWWPIGHVSADAPPLLLIQGGEDRIVRAELTEKFVDRMKAAGADVEYLKIDDAGHGLAYAEDLDVTAPAIEAFFAKHLGAESTDARADAAPPERSPFVVVEDGGSGPHPAVATEDWTLPGITVYRPRDLSPFGAEQKLPVVLWGNGACANTTAEHKNFLSEIASHGYAVLAIGRLDQLEKPAGPAREKTQSKQLLAALDWILAENEATESVYFGKIDATKVAAAGMSCGGLQAIEISGDPRIATTLICNSGVLPEPSPMAGMPALTKDALKSFHAPVLYVMGGPSDIAYENAMDDFARVTHVPFAMANLDVGHAGTFARPRGGAFARVALEWLDWQLKGRDAASKTFLDEENGLADDSDWTLETKNFDR